MAAKTSSESSSLDLGSGSRWCSSRTQGHRRRRSMRDRGAPALEGRLVVLYGDCPLIPGALIRDLVDHAEHADATLGLVTATLADPSGYGRIVRNAAGAVQRDRRGPRLLRRTNAPCEEVNPGLYAVKADFLREAIAQLTPDNAQGQLYLTDVVALAARSGKVVDLRGDMAELTGVNDQRDLALAAATRRRRMAEELARSGVGITDLDTLYIDAECEVEPGAMLGANVHLRGALHRSSRRAHRRGLRAHQRRRRQGRQRAAVHGRRGLDDRRGRAGRPIQPPAPGNSARTAEQESGTSQKPRRPRSAQARRSTTCRTSATGSSAKASTSAPGRSSATTTASRSTRRCSKTASSSAAIPS